MWYWVCLSGCSCIIGTTFPLSNFLTKHIFGILMVLRNYEDHLGCRRRPKIFIFFTAAEAVPDRAPKKFGATEALHFF